MEDAEEAVPSLSGLVLNRDFESFMSTDNSRPKNLPLVVGEIVGADSDEASLRPVVCNRGVSRVR